MESKKVVLAIDDSAQQLQNYKVLLGQKYDLRLVNSAAAAIPFLIKNKPDVILLDVEMPEIDGLTFIAEINKLIIDMNTPIIIVSSRNDDEFYKKALDSSAFEVLTKPVRQNELISIIERALSGKG